MNTDLSKIKKVFMIGIGGIGISALAQMFIAQGVDVSGVNDEEGETTRLLHEKGAKIISKNNFKDLPDADLYVYSDAWLYRGPEIIDAAKKTGKPVMSYFEALGEISKKYKTIAISGTHGKTTTTAMVAGILIDAGLDPTVIVGSIVKKFKSNFRSGEGEYLVVEADEFARHMLHFYPYVGVVTNIEADHLDTYKDLNDIKTAFDKFLAQTEHTIRNYTEYLDKVPMLAVPGEHNRMNAAAALAVADVLGIDLSVAQESLANFEGTWRRLEKRFETKEGTIVYDDYAHHPTEIRASLAALRELYPDKTLTVVFQPHLYSRTRAFFDDFAKSFTDADNLVLLPIYFAREDPDPTVSSEKLAAKIEENGQKAHYCADFASAAEYIVSQNLGSGDVLVTMGAGEAYKVADLVFRQ